jgi:hypothetical protein
VGRGKIRAISTADKTFGEVHRVRGRNLQALIFALENGMVDYIQEFDPDRWTKPDESAAFIESIEVVVQESAGSISAPEKPNEPSAGQR